MLQKKQRVAARAPKYQPHHSTPALLFPLILLVAIGSLIALAVYVLPSKAPAAPPLLPHDAPPLPPSPPPSPSASSSTQINIGLATDEDEPFGLLALVNSTVVHSAAPSDLRFHIIVPQASRKRQRQLLESLFPKPSFRMYSLDVGGARAKILRHLRRREREPVLVSPYRFAGGYLPLVLPSSVSKLVWLQPDVLILSDIRRLYETPMHGAPAAAIEDCSRPAARRFNTTRVGLGEALPAGSCAIEHGVFVLDLPQWQLLDLTSRFEYWLSLNLRAASFYSFDDAHAPLTLALLPTYQKVPNDVWTITTGLSERRVPHNGGSDATVIAGTSLHFSGRWKPWLRNAVSNGGGVLCSRSSSAAGIPCAELWLAYAQKAIRTLGWKQPTIVEASKLSIAATALAVAGTSEDAEPPLGAATITPDPQYSSSSGGGEGADEGGGPPIHLTIVHSDDADEKPPYGLIALINSTLQHSSAATHRRLRIKVFARDETAVEYLSPIIEETFPSSSGMAITITSAPDERLNKLKARLTAQGVQREPFDLPLLWVHSALPKEMPRTLLLPEDTLVLTDVSELYAAAIPSGKACAVIEDCSILFEQLYNFKHPLFASKHFGSSCAFDPSTILIDLKIWRKEDLSSRVLDVLGTINRRTEGLYLQASGMSPSVNLDGGSISAPAMFALDRRALRLPSRWLARGLARESLTFGELQYWERLWGQQGVKLNTLSTRPFRAAHAVALPQRHLGDALMLRYSGGPFKPWLRRCTPSASSAAPLCGRVPPFFDCARIWRRYLSMHLVTKLEGKKLFSCVESAQPPEEGVVAAPESKAKPSESKKRRRGAD